MMLNNNEFEMNCGCCTNNHNGYCIELKKSRIKANDLICVSFKDENDVISENLTVKKVCGKCKYFIKNMCVAKAKEVDESKKSCNYLQHGRHIDISIIELASLQKRMKHEQLYQIRRSYDERV